MTTGTGVLEEILEGQIKGTPNGIGFFHKAQNQKHQHKNFAYALKDYGKDKKKKGAQNIQFVVDGGTYNPTMSKSMLQHPEEHQIVKKIKKSHPWVCHYCGRKGHIRPFCFKLYGYPNQFDHKSPELVVINAKKVWRPKSNNFGLMAHISSGTPSKEDCYFDSGCSRHMTGSKKILDTKKSYISSHIIFGNREKGMILGIGNVSNNGLPNLNNVLLVKGLTSNLISISQLCGQGMNVNFGKSECLVTDEKREVVMRGIKSEGNCYLWIPLNKIHT